MLPNGWSLCDVVTVNGSSVYGYSRVPSRIYLPWTVLSIHDGITENWARNIPKGGSFGTANLDQGDSILFNANFPVFANERDMLKYFSSRGTVINAMNYGTSIDDDITNGSDLPSFTQPGSKNCGSVSQIHPTAVSAPTDPEPTLTTGPTTLPGSALILS